MAAVPPVKARSCKVITTCFVGREVRLQTRMAGDPPGPFVHAQNFPTPESVLELVELNIEIERTVDPGVECDTIVVNNDAGWSRGNRFLESLDGSRTRSGRLRTFKRRNFGRSFGGYHFAFEALRDEYDYWVFTEDDILVAGDGYCRTCIETFESGPRIGFVAIQGISREIALHAHGGVGLTHRRILDAVHRKKGKLPHCGRFESQSYGNIIRKGEVAFTNTIHTLGFELVNAKSEAPLYVYADDYIRRMRAAAVSEKAEQPADRAP